MSLFDRKFMLKAERSVARFYCAAVLADGLHFANGSAQAMIPCIQDVGV